MNIMHRLQEIHPAIELDGLPGHVAVADWQRAPLPRPIGHGAALPRELEQETTTVNISTPCLFMQIAMSVTLLFAPLSLRERAAVSILCR